MTEDTAPQPVEPEIAPVAAAHRPLWRRILKWIAIALLGLVVNLISDLTYTWIDPRIDFETRGV